MFPARLPIVGKSWLSVNLTVAARLMHVSAPGAETCINRAATVKFTLSQLLPTIGRRAGNIPASDPDTHPVTLFTPPACARRRNVHQSCRYSQVHTQPTFAN